MAPRARIFHGWLIVATAFVCHAVNVGLMFYAWSVFLTPLANEFGGRAPVALGYSLTQFATAAYGLVVGRLVDRRGARPVEIVGAWAMAIGYLLVSQVRSLPALYLCLAGPVALGSTCIGALPNNAAVARWFVVRRGRALGIATAGISAGGIVFAPLAQYLITHLGWREAYAVLARSRPRRWCCRRCSRSCGAIRPISGCCPMASHPRVATGRRRASRSSRRRWSARCGPTWRCGRRASGCSRSPSALTMAGLAGVLLYQIPLLVDRGMPATRASLVLGATAAMGVVGKLGFGALLDRFDQRRIAAACFCLQAVGVLLLWQGRGPWLLVCYVVLYGYAMGGNATLQASLVAEAFGRAHFGAIASRLVPFVVTAQALGVPATGYLRDVTGSFTPALLAIIVAALVAAAVVLQVRLPPKPGRR